MYTESNVTSSDSHNSPRPDSACSPGPRPDSGLMEASPRNAANDPVLPEAFIRGLIRDVLNRHGDTDVSSSLLRPAQDFMDAEWELFCRRRPGPYMLAEGCAVSGLQAGLHKGKLMFRWRTSFYPRPRYPSPEMDIYPLGFFREYDLYIVFHEHRPPEAACRYGGGDKSALWALTLPLRAPQAAHEPALREAFERAAQANALWGSGHAAPVPLGSIAMPRQTAATACYR